MINNVSQLSRIESEIRVLQRETALGILSIGDKLLEAKEIVPFGEWEKWLSQNIEMSNRTARNFMRIAQAFIGEDRQAIADLEITKLYLLVELPEDKRNKLLDSYSIREMTTRELKSVISNEKNNSSLKNALDDFHAFVCEVVDKTRELIDGDDIILLSWWMNNFLKPFQQDFSELVVDIESRIGELLPQWEKSKI